MKIITIGLDLAKNVFQVHGVAEGGEVVVRKTLRRRQMIPFFAKLEPCLIGIAMIQPYLNLKTNRHYLKPAPASVGSGKNKRAP